MDISDKVSMAEFISRHDLIWTAVPHKWYEAPFIANGFFGCTVYFDEDNRKMILALGHTCIFDNRDCDPLLDETLIKIPRLPVGNVEAEFSSDVTGVDLRLDIFRAEITGTVFTRNGSVKIRIFTADGTDCIVFEHTVSGEERPNVKYVKSHGGSPRVKVLRRNGENDFADYEEPKKLYEKDVDGVNVFVQPYFNGGGFACVLCGDENISYISISHGDDENKAAAEAVDISAKVSADMEKYLSSHRSWWGGFWSKSFVSFDDGLYEDFLYIQLYKLACASRSDGMPFDTCGPWLTDDTRWPGAWWNLNVELTVSPLYTSNHIDIAKCVSNALTNGIDVLIDNVPEKYRADCAALGRSTEKNLFSPVVEPGNLNSYNSSREAGNLIWALFYCYVEYRMTGNMKLLENTVYPLLKRAVKYYSYFLYTGEDGKLHLKATLSPEYMKSDSDDVNYDLSLLRWGCITLIEINEILGADDCDCGMWKNILDDLTDYPQRAGEGMMIAATTPYAESHRHYSHILAFYPLHVLDRDNEHDFALVNETINYWQSKPEALLGYSQTGAASMRAMMRDGNAALRHLDNLMNGFIRANTMYHEDGNPVLETPPSAATAILEMFIQSHDGYIEFFPAVPDKWKNVCFDGLLCYDGFEAGAELENGRLKWVKVKSLLGKPCRIKAVFDDCVKCDKRFTYENGFFNIDIAEGEEAVLYTDSGIGIHPVEVKMSHCFGLK